MLNFQSAAGSHPGEWGCGMVEGLGLVSGPRRNHVDTDCRTDQNAEVGAGMEAAAVAGMVTGLPVMKAVADADAAVAIAAGSDEAHGLAVRSGRREPLGLPGHHACSDPQEPPPAG